MTEPAFDPPDPRGLAARRQRPFISVCMLTFNNAHTVASAIGSIRPHVDEVVIYDTGSRDTTTSTVAALAHTGGSPIRLFTAGEELTPALYPEGTISDIAFARNRSFELASANADWLMWLDPDDEAIVNVDLHAVLARARVSTDAVSVAYDAANSEGVSERFWRERIARRGRLEWRHRVHELLAPKGGVGGRFDVEHPRLARVEHDDFCVAHRPAIGHDRVAWKLRILRDIEAEATAMGMEADSRTLWFLGAGYERNSPDAAIGYFVRASLTPGMYAAWALRDLGGLLAKRGDHWLALHVYNAGVQMSPESVACRLGLAESLMRLGFDERAAVVAQCAVRIAVAAPTALDHVHERAADTLARLQRIVEIADRVV